jgi:hypothetical protein
MMAAKFQQHRLAWSLFTANAIFFHNPDVFIAIASGLA